MRLLILIAALIAMQQLHAQSFIRSELSATLTSPWEIIYGPDNFLWLSEGGGKISRVDPASGQRTLVYTAPDYWSGSISERSPLCFQPYMGYGTLGMALHPNFSNSATAYIYLVHSYNAATPPASNTMFKIRRVKWDAGTGSIVGDTTLVDQLPSGYDHLGGRLMIIPQNNTQYLFYTMGDHGISETNSPTCYTNQATNPNNFTQDPAYPNGKVHRYNLDGSIPAGNPIPGNSFYTRGHRNPQGLAYNPNANVIYEVEHGDRTDDEINVLQPGMNYGWKFVRGYHNDNNFPGEAAYIGNYTPHAQISGDALKEPLYAWCATSQPTVTLFTDWCTVAPSDAIYYNSNGIPGWNNSLLVVTLKDGPNTDMELFRFKLTANGLGLEPSTAGDPNPQKFFGQDQALNGRLRDVAISPDGTKIYLINNFGADRDKITVYTLDPNSSVGANTAQDFNVNVYPNPFDGTVRFTSTEIILEIRVYNMIGEIVKHYNVNSSRQILCGDLSHGAYLAEIKTQDGRTTVKKLFGK